MSGRHNTDEPSINQKPIQAENQQIEKVKRHPGGRPSMYTPELGAKICHLYATDPAMTFRKICAMDDMPSWLTLWEWINGHVEAVGEFPTLFARAKAARASMLAEQALTNADGPGDDDDTMVRVRRDEFRAKTAQWMAAKLNPVEFGDNQRLSVDVSVQHSVAQLTDDQLMAIVQRHQAQLAASGGQAALPASGEVIEVEAERVDSYATGGLQKRDPGA